MGVGTVGQGVHMKLPPQSLPIQQQQQQQPAVIGKQGMYVCVSARRYLCVYYICMCVCEKCHRSTIFHCHLILVGRGKNENIKDENMQHNTKQWYRSAFSGPKLENKNR